MRALVTGSSSGIGRAICSLFEAQSWEVVGVARTDPHHPMDLADAPALKRLLLSLDTLDAIVHCAYTYEPSKVAVVGQDALELLWMFGSPALQKARGALVVVSSIAAADPDTPYALDKRAQERRAIAFAKEGAPDVRVNIVRPHLVAGTRTHRAQDRKRAVELPLQRYGRPDEVADAIWLCAVCKHMTGSTVTVDGGWGIR